MKPSKIKACLKYLVVEGAIYKEGAYYRPSARSWKPDLEKSRKITEIRKNELDQMNEFANTRSCYMKYIADVLNDSHAKLCGKCSNCLGDPIISENLQQNTLLKAQRFMKEDFHEIQPRRQWPSGVAVNGKNRIPGEFLCETGRVLSNYGDAGWGRLVVQGKYRDNHFDDQLVKAAAELLAGFVEERDIRWVTNIPSVRRPALVSEFAERLAADDMVDSRWTFTICGYKLREAGSGKVFPFALANSAGKDGR